MIFYRVLSWKMIYYLVLSWKKAGNRRAMAEDLQRSISCKRRGGCLTVPQHMYEIRRMSSERRPDNARIALSLDDGLSAGKRSTSTRGSFLSEALGDGGWTVV